MDTPPPHNTPPHNTPPHNTVPTTTVQTNNAPTNAAPTNNAVLIVGSPLAGTAIGLPDVPDPVFAQAMVGPGAAVDPERTPLIACSPITGTLVKLKPHAFVVAGRDGRGVLVHLGIDTVNLDGAGFELLAVEGTEIEAGTPVIRWNPAEIEAGGLSPICPVIALDAAAAAVDSVAAGAILPGATLFHWTG